MQKTRIEWTDATWNPIRGCSRVSEGCRNCYAETIANRFKGPNQPYEGLLAKGGQWNGQVSLIQSQLETPFRWRRPRRVFVNSTSDLFHENVPDWFIDRVFAVMALCPQHQFQILTKRPARMRDYCRSLGRHHDSDPVSLEAKRMRANKGFFYHLGKNGWHLPNVWLGTSIEDQATANERIPHLLHTRFISAEPLLGPVDLDDLVIYEDVGEHHFSCLECDVDPQEDPWKGACIDWVIVGGESGPNARPMNPDWPRSLRDQCVAAGVPFFFKQWGEWGFEPYPPRSKTPYESRHMGRDVMFRCGKKRASRILDGRTWDEFPEVAA